MSLQVVYEARLRQSEINNQISQKRHPHPELLEMKPSFWQRIRTRHQPDTEVQAARIRPA